MRRVTAKCLALLLSTAQRWDHFPLELRLKLLNLPLPLYRKRVTILFVSDSADFGRDRLVIHSISLKISVLCSIALEYSSSLFSFHGIFSFFILLEIESRLK